MQRMVLGVVMVAFAGGSWAADAPKGWTEETVPTTKKDGYPAAVWMPKEGEAPKDGWPVVVWLNATNVRETDASKLKKDGLPSVLDDLPAKFVLVAPMLAKSDFGWKTVKLNDTLAEVLKKDATDDGRVYLSGFNTGATAAFEWAAADPTKFQGLALLSGPVRAKPDQLKAVVPLPVWLVNGETNAAVFMTSTKSVERSLSRAGGTVKLTELKKVGYDQKAMTKAMLDEKIVDWLLEQKRAE